MRRRKTNCAQKRYGAEGERVAYVLSNQSHSSQQHMCMCLSLHMCLHFHMFVSKLLYRILVLIVKNEEEEKELCTEEGRGVVQRERGWHTY
jgi:hypothetical protein